MTRNEKNELESVNRLVELGINMLGAGGGAAIGVVLGGPLGAIAGAVYGPFLANTIREIGNEINERHLSKREKERIGATIYLTVKKIQENIDNGQQIRQDWFQEQSGERTAGEEIFEGTLLATQREHEEKKLPFYANLLANIAFHPEIDRSQANLLIRLGQSISYQQMCLMAIFASKDGLNLGHGRNLRSESANNKALSSLLYEADELISQKLLRCSRGTSGNLLTTISPDATHLQGVAVILHDLMELQKIGICELSQIAELLRR